MHSLSETILKDYQVRKTKKQKSRFIDMIKENFPEAKVEQGGFLNNRNIVIGDIDNAEVIFSAHYDTCAVLPFPNLIMPKNIFFTILYSLIICIPFFVAMHLTNYLLGFFTDEFWIHYYISLFVFIGLFLLVFIFGIPNKHTANDNTSGVVALCEMILSMTKEEKSKCAFVFFDNEENGLLGSAYFRKLHKTQIKDKLLINLDCVGDGDNFIVVENKPANEKYGALLRGAFSENMGKTMYFEKSSTTYYPSDQAGFPISVAVASMNKSRLFGLYMNRIHTRRDTVCDEGNIAFVCESLTAFVRELNK